MDLVIPIQKETELLDSCVQSIEKYTTNYNLHICKDPQLNVGECRQNALNSLKLGQYVCFLDDDSLLLHTGWLDALVTALQLNQKAAVAFAEEQWGEGQVLNIYNGTEVIGYGPAACMLLDRDRIPISVKWDKYMGLKTGWLGGDFEEVDYVRQIQSKGLQCLGVHGSRFQHTDRTTLTDFNLTDRHQTCSIMKWLINHKFMTNPNNVDYFKQLHYVKAQEDNDRMLAPGHTLKECFRDVIIANHLEQFPIAKRWELI